MYFSLFFYLNIPSISFNTFYIIRRLSPTLHECMVFFYLQKPQGTKGSYLTLTCQTINNLQDLYGFFSTIGIVWPQTTQQNQSDTESVSATCLHEIETVLAADFLEKMPAATNLSAR